ncbi:MAG: 2-dehydropantoate 2-reductase [Lentisphaerae bacterium]|nr:2-dehydropantoate 2-reductase [Lentisphaerota bacterium]
MTNKPSVVIVGPGAIGGLLACRLQSAGVPVALLDHDHARAVRLNTAGLHLLGDEGERVYPIPVTAHPDGVRPPTWLVLCVKRFQTRAALTSARPLIARHTTIVSLQNGMGEEEAMLAAADPHRVLCAVTAMGATRQAEDRWQQAGHGITNVSAWRPEAEPRAEAFVMLLARAGIDALYHPNAVGMLWSKLIINAAINPVSALAGQPNGAILEHPGLRATAHSAAREGVAVAEALGITLDYPDVIQRVDEVCAATATNRSSMLQDMTRHRPTEIDSINGTIVRHGCATSIPIPVNAQLVTDINSH